MEISGDVLRFLSSCLLEKPGGGFCGGSVFFGDLHAFDAVVFGRAVQRAGAGVCAVRGAFRVSRLPLYGGGAGDPAAAGDRGSGEVGITWNFPDLFASDWTGDSFCCTKNKCIF